MEGGPLLGCLLTSGEKDYVALWDRLPLYVQPCHPTGGSSARPPPFHVGGVASAQAGCTGPAAKPRLTVSAGVSRGLRAPGVPSSSALQPLLSSPAAHQSFLSPPGRCGGGQPRVPAPRSLFPPPAMNQGESLLAPAEDLSCPSVSWQRAPRCRGDCSVAELPFGPSPPERRRQRGGRCSPRSAALTDAAGPAAGSELEPRPRFPPRAGGYGVTHARAA